MMVNEDEPVDPLVDPFGTIDNDPLRYYKNSGFFKDSSSSDEDLSSYKIPASLTIIPSSSAKNLKVHKIPAYTNSITITKVENKKQTPLHSTQNDFSYYSDEQSNFGLPTIKRGRKKGSKNKFKKGVPIIENWNSECDALDLSNKMKSILRENFIQTELSMRLNSSIIDKDAPKPKRKYEKKNKLNGFQKSDLHKLSTVPLYKESSNYLEIEIDPAELFPDEPMPKEKIYRKKKKDQNERSFECDICKKGFKCIRGVQAHKSVKHDIEDLSGYYPCEICEEIFALKRDLSNHYSSHQNELSRYPCPDIGCDVTEPDVGSLVKHKKKKHPYLGTLGRTWFHNWLDR